MNDGASTSIPTGPLVDEGSRSQTPGWDLAAALVVIGAIVMVTLTLVAVIR